MRTRAIKGRGRIGTCDIIFMISNEKLFSGATMSLMEDNRVLPLEAGWSSDAELSHGDKLLTGLMGWFIPNSPDLTIDG